MTLWDFLYQANHWQWAGILSIVWAFCYAITKINKLLVINKRDSSVHDHSANWSNCGNGTKKDERA